MESHQDKDDQRVRAALDVPLQRALGAELVDPADVSAGVRFPVAGLALTPAGTLHAAALAAIIELTGYLTVLPTLKPTEHAVTFAISTQYLNAAHGGDWVKLTGVLTKRARALAFVSVVSGIEDEAADQHRLIAHSLLTKTVISATSVPP